MGELAATLTLAQDNAFGQPLESQLRSCMLGMWLCDAAGFDADVHNTVYWVALLRYIGCTGHAHEVATLFGDEIAIRAQTLIHDAGNPAEVMRDVVAFASANHPPEEHEELAAALHAGGHEWAVHNFASGCEVGDMLLERLHFSDDVRASLACTFERWNGKGFPNHVSGFDIPLAMRIVHLTHDMEAIERHFSAERALDAARKRRDTTYDPELVDLFLVHGDGWFQRLGKSDPWDIVLELEPEPHHTLSDVALDEALVVMADFIDLKSPYLGGHSRRCADLASSAAALLGRSDDDVVAVRRAALVHEFGTTAIPNSIWDKPSPLTRAEFDRVELHPMLTEQMLRRSPALAPLNAIASAHHEKSDGSGYHRRLQSAALDENAATLVAVDIYVGLTTERADRPAFSSAQAANELSRLVSEGILDESATDAVLQAAGHQTPTVAEARQARHPGGLTKREVEVLCLASRGATTKEIAETLFISPKTADHHIQHVYTKIGVSSRAAAALWAMQHDMVS